MEERKCFICGDKFAVKYPSIKTKTCSKKCKNLFASQITTRQFESEESRIKHRLITKEAMSHIDMKRIVRENRVTLKGKNHPLYGKPCSALRKKRIGDANRGRFKGWTWDKMYNPETAKKMRRINSEFMCKTNAVLLNDRTSKLEKTAAKFLVPQGFRQNVQVGKYIADFIHDKKRIIIEIYGNYWHAHPKLFKPFDQIKAIKMTAQEKWDYDKKREKYLRNKGYKVEIIWEEDFIGHELLQAR
tara:strand:- start:7247 stop:7978 length:732 start_codon:yes stop_codon:yes gene_type:complete